MIERNSLLKAVAMRYFKAMVFTLLIAFAVRGNAAEAIKEDTFAGMMAPGWKLESLTGLQHDLADLRGKVVVLNFWATWCAPCRIETQWLVRLHQQYRVQGLEIVGISMDEATDDPEVARFAARYAVPYPILLRGQSIASKYGGIRFLPQTFFIDRSGKIVRNAHGIHDAAMLEGEITRLLQSPGVTR